MTRYCLWLVCLVLFSCNRAQFEWVQSKVDENNVDVFYIASTDVFKSYFPDSTESYTAVLTDEEVGFIAEENLYVRSSIFKDSLNFFAPIYHQFTMSAILNNSSEEFAPIYNGVANEVCAAFDYYMENMNGGRRFILAGFSQGAMYVRDVLKHMTEEQYSRMVAAYMFGFGLSEQDCLHDHIVPASDRFSTGVTVSFNSVADTASIWPIVHNDACTCINPMNWKTDGTPCVFSYEGDSLTVAVDTSWNVLKVSGFDEEKYPIGFDAPWSSGCLHHFEIFFYNDAIYRNALDRARTGSTE